ncbi:MAG: acyltransferase [Steroidobacteraceae bacterium]
MAERPSGKVEELESIRGVAAVLVVFFHMPAWNPALYDIHIIRNSYYMVDLFFVLSGFVMYINYGERLRTFRDLAKFQLLRIGRLYPVHLLFLLVALGMALSKWLAAARLGMTLPNGGAFKDAGVAAFFEHLFLVQSLGFTPESSHAYNTASWSISVEFFTYIVFGLLTLITLRSLRLWIFALITVFAMSLLHFFHYQVENFSPILQCLAGYFLGCLTAVVGEKKAASLPSLVGFAVLVALTVFTYLADAPEFNIAIFFLSAALILSVILGKEGIFRSMLRNKVLVFLGLISYSVYMSHFCVLWAFNIFIRVIFKRPEAMTSGVSYPQLTVWEASLASLLAVAATLILSTIVFKTIEDPMRRKSRDWVRKLFP